MKHLTRTLIQFVLVVALFLLAACGSNSAAPTAVPEAATAAPTAEVAAPEAVATEAPAESTPVTDTPVSETAPVTETAPITETAVVSGSAESYTDPFAYCVAVGASDAPVAPYSGEAMPENVLQGLQTAMGTEIPLEVLSNGTAWRCMDQKVYACFTGANLPCTEKANTSETPTQAELDFCADSANTNADTIPAVVTGHNTVYSWRCTDGKPEIVEQVFQTDAQGFVSDIWYALPNP